LNEEKKKERGGNNVKAIHWAKRIILQKKNKRTWGIICAATDAFTTLWEAESRNSMGASVRCFHERCLGSSPINTDGGKKESSGTQKGEKTDPFLP